MMTKELRFGLFIYNAQECVGSEKENFILGNNVGFSQVDNPANRVYLMKSMYAFCYCCQKMGKSIRQTQTSKYKINQ